MKNLIGLLLLSMSLYIAGFAMGLITDKTVQQKLFEKWKETGLVIF